MLSDWSYKPRGQALIQSFRCSFYSCDFIELTHPSLDLFRRRNALTHLFLPTIGMDSSTIAHQFSDVMRPADFVAQTLNEAPHRRVVSLQAGLAEMILVNRLRAHTRSDLALDTLQRGSKIIALTAQHWFADKGHVGDVHLNARSLACVVGSFRVL